MSTRTVLVCDNCKRDMDALPYRLATYSRGGDLTMFCSCATYNDHDFCSQACAVAWVARRFADDRKPSQPSLIERVIGKKAKK